MLHMMAYFTIDSIILVFDETDMFDLTHFLSSVCVSVCVWVKRAASDETEQRINCNNKQLNPQNGHFSTWILAWTLC